MSDFWSRRKAAVEAEALAEDKAQQAAEEEAREAVLAEKSDEELLAEHNFAPPEELTSPEEVQAFLKSALPQRLKTRALRRLWRLNPILANVDGLVDYGEDYTDAATVIENMQTVYQVGKGMFDKAVADAEAAEAKAAAAAKAEAVSEDDDAPDTSVDEDDDLLMAENEDATPVAPSIVGHTQTAFSDGADDPEFEAPAPSRRMRFRFDTA